MFVMRVPGADPAQPGAIIPFSLTQIALDRAINKDTRDSLIIRSKTNQHGMMFIPTLINPMSDRVD
ncbi:hypothetical protein HSBAA_31280 [Vreelandella sulfidaeris]|uniref:Uncharacterized protein n=1 Tax=Vreelandella sulfidaeris TaxID=115553 RepID=A0A455U6R9_9GAMM|nr:hypothetical protein HSBAA_31280 [Halomonas sulfidaeris]